MATKYVKQSRKRTRKSSTRRKNRNKSRQNRSRQNRSRRNKYFKGGWGLPIPSYDSKKTNNFL